MIGALLVLLAWLPASLPCVDDCDAHCSDCVVECVEACDESCHDGRCRRVCVRSCERQCSACRRFCRRRLECTSGRGRDAQAEVPVVRPVEALDRLRGCVVVVEGDVAEAAAPTGGERDHARRRHAGAIGEELAQRTVVGVLRKTSYVQRAVL